MFPTEISDVEARRMTLQVDQVSGQRSPNPNVRYHQVKREDVDGSITSTTDCTHPPSASSANSGSRKSGDQPKSTKPKIQPMMKVCKPLKQKWKRTNRAYARAVVDHWTYELLAAFVCISTLTAIMAVLFVFHDKPSPHVMAGVPLNTVISILATISRASTVLVAAAVIAQQKWLRYKKEAHSLIDVLTYDDATRGPLGSLYLLTTWRVSFFTALAAMVVVLALGFEPFVQQSVRYPLKDYPVSNSSLPLFPAVQSLTENNFGSKLNLNLSIPAVITQALYADTIEPLRPNCPSAACTWSLHRSIAFCSSCEDGMNDLTISPQDDPVLRTHTKEYYSDNFQTRDLDFGEIGFDLRMAMPRSTSYSLYFSNNNKEGSYSSANFELLADCIMHITGSYTTFLTYPSQVVWHLEGDNVNGVQSPMNAFGYANLSLSADGRRLIATSVKRCVISMCAKQYSSTSRDSSFVSNVTDMTWGHFSPVEWTGNLSGSSFNSAFNLTPWADRLSLLEGSVISTIRSFETLDTPVVQNPSADSVRFMSDIERACANIAQGLTNFIQQYGDSVIPGQTYVSTSVVEVRWIWLTFPISLIAVVLVTFLATVIQTHDCKLPTWKTSPFPLFFNYRDPNARSESPGNYDHEPEDQGLHRPGGETTFETKAVKTSAHEEMASKTKLRLRPIDGNWIIEKES